jgi:hypothetical protein
MCTKNRCRRRIEKSGNSVRGGSSCLVLKDETWLCHSISTTARATGSLPLHSPSSVILLKASRETHTRNERTRTRKVEGGLVIFVACFGPQTQPGFVFE